MALRLRAFVLLLCFSNIVSSLPLDNSSPLSNSTDYGDPNLYCTNATLGDIAVFYLANYFVHCATVKVLPGENTVSSFAAMALALFFPTTGVTRAICAIVRHARFNQKDELRAAARAGALCMLVRSRFWEPREGDVIRDCRTTTSQAMAESGRWKYEFSSNATEDFQLQSAKSPTNYFPEGELPICVWDPHWMAELLPVDGSQKIYALRRKVHGNVVIPEGYRQP